MSGLATVVTSCTRFWLGMESLPGNRKCHVIIYSVVQSVTSSACTPVGVWAIKRTVRILKNIFYIIWILYL